MVRAPSSGVVEESSSDLGNRTDGTMNGTYPLSYVPDTCPEAIVERSEKLRNRHLRLSKVYRTPHI